jgi:hypothetical protein
MEPNLPATQGETATRGEYHEPESVGRRQPIAVAFLPLALVWFIILAFVMATWTFLAAGS